MTGRYSSSGGRAGSADLSNSSYGFEYVGSIYNVGIGMWNSMTAYVASSSDINTDSFSAHERQYLATTGFWTSTYQTVLSNSRDW